MDIFKTRSMATTNDALGGADLRTAAELICLFNLQLLSREIAAFQEARCAKKVHCKL